MTLALYVHVPFCESRCAYCGFYSGESLQWCSQYPEWVAAEARLRRAERPGKGRLTSVYLGGGTPSLLGEAGIGRVLEAARNEWGVAQDAEVTVEVNPGVPTDLVALRRLGVNRLSVGVQALDDGVLASLGRRHTAACATGAVQDARRAGFPRVSADLLYGVPGLRPGALRDWVYGLSAQGADHVSAYSLELHPGTPLAEAVALGLAEACGSDEEESQWWELTEALAQEGYEAYEVSNFAWPGARCRHNVAYWEGGPYLGLGPGAHGYEPAEGMWGTRWWNAPSLHRYRESLLAGILPPGGREILTRDEALLETLFLAFRRTQPLGLGSVPRRFRLDPVRWAETLARLERHGFLRPAGAGCWTPTLEAARRADGLALWIRELMVSAAGAP
ncbi:MAG: coproporphyrinogen-III oxidase family protein [Deferrisomatales bacterium]|nr:coproporphyrinogen-III oxidase family protein [Deferrisomatales bacterium]